MISVYERAWWQLIKFDVLLLTRGFATLYYRVRTHPLRKLAPPRAEVDQLATAFELACIWYPKRVRCLQRSAALTCLLRSYGIPAQMVIGTQKLPFKAHAWVEVESRVLCDKEYTPEMYAVLDRC
jgi:Transglutaminase-like superfamily